MIAADSWVIAPVMLVLAPVPYFFAKSLDFAKPLLTGAEIGLTVSARLEHRHLRILVAPTRPLLRR